MRRVDLRQVKLVTGSRMGQLDFFFFCNPDSGDSTEKYVGNTECGDVAQRHGFQV